MFVQVGQSVTVHVGVTRMTTDGLDTWVATLCGAETRRPARGMRTTVPREVRAKEATCKSCIKNAPYGSALVIPL